MIQVTLSRRQVAGYGIGDFAINLYWSGTAYFLLYWYTDVAGLPNEMAGFLFFIGSIWDAITDPAMGVIAERTQTRWGKYRPYFLFGSVPLAASFVLLLWVPPFTGMALTGTLIAAHLLFRTALTVVGIPYISLSARLTRSSQERIRLAGARMIAATCGGITIAASAFPLANWLGDGDEKSGFFALGILAGVLAVIVQIVCFLNTEEKVNSTQAQREERVSFKDLLKNLRQNRAFILLFFAILFISIASVLMGKNILYFIKYGLGEHERQYVAVLANGLFGLFMIPVWMYIAQVFGKRKTWLMATAIIVVGLIALYSAEITGLYQFIGHLLFITLGSSALGLMFWSMLPDTVEYGEWKSGVRSEAIIFGFTTFAQKASIGAAGWILGYLLTMTGYQSNEVQSEETIQGLLFIMTIIPLVFYLGGAFLIWQYPIENNLHKRIVDEIDARRNAIVVDVPE